AQGALCGGERQQQFEQGQHEQWPAPEQRAQRQDQAGDDAAQGGGEKTQHRPNLDREKLAARLTIVHSTASVMIDRLVTKSRVSEPFPPQSSRARVSRAICFSSLVGTTRMRGVPGRWMAPVTPPMQVALVCGSMASPNGGSQATVRARTRPEFSPMPPVKSSRSRGGRAQRRVASDLASR